MQTDAVPLTAQDSIVSGGNAVEAVLQRIAQHRAELDGAVAQDAGIGRSSRAVLCGEHVHHLAAENFAQIHRAVRDSEDGGSRGGVGRSGAVPRQQERRALDLAALAGKQNSGGGAVHAAAHAEKNPSHSQISLSSAASSCGSSGRTTKRARPVKKSDSVPGAGSSGSPDSPQHGQEPQSSAQPSQRSSSCT